MPAALIGTLGIMSLIEWTGDRAEGDGLIDALLGAAARVGSPLSQIEILAQGGAIARVGSEATAYPHRDAAWLINAREVAWARESYTSLAPHLTGGTYVNFMAGDEDGAGTGIHARTLARLQEVKSAYDPHNVFALNQNVSPSTSPSSW